MENGFGQITSGATQHAGPSNSQIMAMATSPVASGPTRMSTRPRMPSLAGREPQTLAELALAKSQPATPVDYTYAERTTRSKTQKPKLASKVKLKLGEKATQGIGTSFLGPYDRELDTDDEEDQDLVFEEQFILKMPEGEDCDQLRTMVQARTVTSDVWFRFNGESMESLHRSSDLSERWPHRCPSRNVPHWQQHLRIQAGRPPLRHRVSEDSG